MKVYLTCMDYIRGDRSSTLDYGVYATLDKAITECKRLATEKYDERYHKEMNMFEPIVGKEHGNEIWYDVVSLLGSYEDNFYYIREVEVIQ